MKMELDKGIAEFCTMMIGYIKEKSRHRIQYFFRNDGDILRLGFYENKSQLLALFLGEQRRVFLFADIKVYPVLREELLELFKFLEFKIEDKSK